MNEKATSVEERIQFVRNLVRCHSSVIDRPESQEDGVRTAIAQIYTYLPRAGRDRRSLPK